MSEFKFKPFEEMTPEDYKAIGFMSGLEIHQQLYTEKKLFCRCPAGHYSSEYHAEILRHMRPTLSEMGEYDGTALMEFKTKKDIIYRINRGTVCTYEMDDTPPFEMNPQALDIAIEIGKLLNSSIVDEIHIARKQYLDGSIPTGFQRTAIVSVGGWVPFKDRKLNIIQMSIEEDSCREAGDVGHVRTYIADRLGMPLIEMVTAPELKTPHEVAEANNLLRRLARSTRKVRTGMGATRQDVNVSVTGGTRIEIKGVAHIKSIPLLTYNEAMRQWNLLRLRDELNSRGITADTFQAKVDDVTKLLHKTRYTPISSAIQEGKVVKAVTLRGWKNLLRWQTQTDTFFSKEISDRVRVIACLSTIPNIIHSDYLGETISSSEGLKLRRAAGATENDTLVLVWGSEGDTETAVKEIIIRAKEATIGIPAETRQALWDGTNGFERILPGADRMYPDTDLPPRVITTERVAAIVAQMPERIWDTEARFAEMGVPKELIQKLSLSRFKGVFEKAVEMGISAKVASIALVSNMKNISRMNLCTCGLTEELMLEILSAYKAGRISRHGILKYTIEAAKACDQKLELPKAMSNDEIKAIVAKNKPAADSVAMRYPEEKENHTIGLIMKGLEGRVEPMKAFEIYKSL